MTEPNLDTFKFNWNGTNYTFYDSSLVLAMNFNNNSAIGENDTKAVDISKYGNNGTIYGTSNTLDNTTVLAVNQTDPVNLTHLISIPAVNFTSDFNLTISYLNNTYANETIRVYVNRSYIGNFTTAGATTTQYAYFYNILRGNFTAGAASNITYEANSTNITQSRLQFTNTPWVQGKFGNALQFDGSNDYVDAGNAASLNITNAITIEVWVKSNAQTVHAGIVWKKQQTYAPDYGLMVLTGENPTFRITNSTGGIGQPASPSQISIGAWHHLVGTYDGANVILYIDGTNNSQEALTGAIRNSGEVVRIGTRDANANFFNGTIDEVRIWNRSLSAPEIAMHYLSELQKYNATTWQFYNNITNLADRAYTYYAWSNDTSNNANQTDVRTLTIDNLAPRLTLVLPQNATYPTTALSLNYTVSDVISLDKVWYFYNNQNVTLTGNTTFTALNNQQSTIYIYANDTLGRVNVTNVTFTVDTTPPSVFLSLSQSSLYAGDPITISCSASDVHISTTSLTVTKPDNTPASATCNQPFSTSQTGTYTVWYSATDTLGHSASTSQTFLASRSPSSSLGSSFSSGSATPPSKAIVVTSNEAIEKIIVNLKTQLQSAFLTIANVPTAITEPVQAERNVYQYLNITKANFENADIENARIDFRVNKTWYSKNEIALVSTSLLRYDGKSWHALPTVQTGEDPTTYSFAANTTAFSLFAITGRTAASKGGTPPQPTVTTAVTPIPIPQIGTPTSTVITTPPPVLPQAPNKRPRPFTAIIVLLAIIFLGALLYMRSSRTFVTLTTKSPRQQQQRQGNKKAAPNEVVIEGIATRILWNDDFEVFDGTGFISVRFSGKIPKRGDKVRATGTLASRDGKQYISASSVEEV